MGISDWRSDVFSACRHVVHRLFTGALRVEYRSETLPLDHMQPDGYEIKLPQFEGPFDLLLFFIERDELNIHDIPIAKITTDFLDYLLKAQEDRKSVV